MQKFFTKQGLRPQSLPARAAIHVPKPKFIDEDEGKEYEVEEIIDQRVVHKHSKTKPVSMEYKVRWKGYQEVDDTWEPEENLAHCQGKLKKFYASERRAVV
jgi:chromobox protein 1/chromobox protein 5